jgi:hypothetical protein
MGLQTVQFYILLLFITDVSYVRDNLEAIQSYWTTFNTEYQFTVNLRCADNIDINT